ncbi:DUF3800 domain-containing protein [Streptomyces sp. TRM64462]|uniref:DUF3800 domain-containing protein n=1 Tax=Streptomyces sp. TRM64462 TaxID=2741726 RepID=UPI00158658FB|nr:DUF3800 domain-containing protein [Streptomyces sp. TRM64462]
MAAEHSAAPLRLYFVDDGGDRTTPFFASLGIDLSHADTARRHWQDFRAELAADARLEIPAASSLHAVDLAGARGRHVHRSRSTDRATHRRHTQEVILRGLRNIAAMPGARVRAVYRETDDYGRDRPALYAALLRQLNAELAGSRVHGVVIVDGDGTDGALRRAHRALPDEGRYIVGDPVFQPARELPLLQAADLLAYAAYQSVAKRSSREFMWHWFGAALPGAHGPSAL